MNRASHCALKDLFRSNEMRFSEPKDYYEFAFNEATRRRAVPADLRSAVSLWRSQPEQPVSSAPGNQLFETESNHKWN